MELIKTGMFVVKKIVSVVLMVGLAFYVAGCGNEEMGQESSGKTQTRQEAETAIDQEKLEDQGFDGEGRKNPYFYVSDENLLEAHLQYEDTDTGEVRETNIHFTVCSTGGSHYKNGTLYEISLGHSYGIEESLSRLYFYVTPDKIYKVRSYQEQDGKRIPLFRYNQEPYHVWSTDEELIKNSDIVCQEEDMESTPEEGTAGTHVSIRSEGSLVIFSRREVDADGKTGFYETFVWKEGEGLTEYRNGYGEGTDLFCLSDIILPQSRFWGTWRMEEVAVISTMYTGTTLDGDFEEYLYDSADYIGLELEYTPQMFRLGDMEYENPIYEIRYRSVLDIDCEGGRPRFEPHLYDYLIDKGIDVKEMGNPMDPTVMVYYVRFEEDISYGKYPFIPVGAECILLNDNTMIVGVWGKLLLAHRIE